LTTPFTKGESVVTPNFISAALPAAVRASAQDLKRYKLWRVPDDTDNICFKLIGQGGIFCISHHCTTEHRGTKFFHPLPGEIYVLKTQDKAFIAPTMSANVLGDTLWERWFSEMNTLDEWNDRFALVQQEIKFPVLREASTKITELDLLAAEEQNNVIMEYKTPFKRQKVQEQKILEDFPDLEPLILSTTTYVDDVKTSVLAGDITSTVKIIRDLMFAQQKGSDDSIQGLRNLELRLSRVVNDLGTKPPSLEEAFNAPNLWLSLASIVDHFKTISKSNIDLSAQIGEISSQVNSIDVHKTLKTLMPQSLSGIHHQLNQLDHFAVEATRTLSNRINKVESTRPSETSDLSEITQKMDDMEKVLNSRLVSLENQLSAIKSQTDSTSIKFAQLGFRNISESNAWMEINHPGPEFGFLIDYHLTMEHVHVQITGQKLLANLEKIYKMSLKTNNQALAISSFESRLPRFFSQDAKSHVRKDESYFPGIKTWDEWDLPNDGYRDRMKVELYMFKVGHQETLDNELDHLSPYHNLCVLALTEAVSWANGLIKFIDDTYNEYSRSKYGSKKAWHLTTLLAKALVEKVAKPRNSVQNSFRISNPADVSKAITYASLRSLDNMMEITSFNFKNSPIVTSEISKFLALNANHETVEKMQSTLTSMSSDNDVLRKEVKAASSAASTASNKIDTQVKTALEDIKRRLKSLESKK